ncbi:MAG: hypothetical protein AAGA91_04675 [Pseudomonadota bacterium]
MAMRSAKEGCMRSWLCSMALVVCLLADFASAADGEPEDKTVQALPYGVTLFYYFQQDYFSALTELMTAQQQKALGNHKGRGELLRGGMSLAYGMDNQAEAIFEDVLTEPDGAADRDAAWFFLAKVAWQRGQTRRASEALDRMEAGYSGDTADEARYLSANIHIRKGDTKTAGEQLALLPEDSSWRYYLHYNLGATHAASDRWRQAVSEFRRFDTMEADSDEERLLKDRAHTASGYARMAAGDYSGARDDFSRVRLEGPLSDRALLGHGWASGELGDYRAALSPWQVLSDRPLIGRGARESLLALPYAYEQLAMPGNALSGYRAAADAYVQELVRLEEVIEVFQKGDIGFLLPATQEEASDWLFEADVMPEGEYAPYIGYLVTTHDFQIALREWRDLYRIAGHLARARERLAVLSHVDQHQQLVWSEVIETQQRDVLMDRQRQLQVQVASLIEAYRLADETGDARALADPVQRQRWNRLDHAYTVADGLALTGQQADRLRILKGLMVWDDSEQFTARSWMLKRQLRDLQGLLSESQRRVASLDLAISQRQASDYAPRISALLARTEAQVLQVDLALDLAETGVRRLAVAELNSQSEQLAQSLGQSRLALARLYDNVSLGSR